MAYTIDITDDSVTIIGTDQDLESVATVLHGTDIPQLLKSRVIRVSGFSETGIAALQYKIGMSPRIKEVCIQRISPDAHKKEKTYARKV